MKVILFYSRTRKTSPVAKTQPRSTNGESLAVKTSNKGVEELEE
jgi:hypothetical protein